MTEIIKNHKCMFERTWLLHMKFDTIIRWAWAIFINYNCSISQNRRLAVGVKFPKVTSSTSLLMVLTCIGVHTAASIDDSVSCSYMPCLLGACLPLPMLLISAKLDTFLTYSCLGSIIIASTYGMEVRLQPKSHATCQTFMCLSAANVVMTVMLISMLYHNCSVTTRDGVEIPLREAFHNILVSPAWAEFRQTAVRLFHCLVNDGLHKFIYELRVVLDPEGEVSAYKVSVAS